MAKAKAKPSQPQLFDPAAPDTTERDQDHLNTDWAMANAFRELIKIARRGSIEATFRQAIALGEELLPDHFSPEKRMLHGVRETPNARYIRQLAEAQSVREGRSVPPVEVAERLISQERGNALLNPEGELIQTRLNNLQLTLEELKPKKTTEHQVIFRDVFRVVRDLPITREGKNSKQYQLDKDRALRIRILHPDKPEHKTGADLIYEHLDTKREVARIAHIQYKMWNRSTFVQDERMEKQCTRLRAMACQSGMCKTEYEAGQTYRLPHCSAFLRPTDILQKPDALMMSSGMHVPLCVLDRLAAGQSKTRKSYSKRALEGKALSHKVFEELFNTRMLGSIEIGFDDLTTFYDSIKIFDYEDTVIIHAQEFNI